MRILMATTVLPEPARGGGEVVSAALVTALARSGAQVDVVGLLRPGTAAPPAPEGATYRIAARRPIESADAGKPQLASWFAAALARREPFSVAKYRARGYGAALARSGAWDLAIVDHLQVAWLAPRLGGRFVLVDHNHEAAIYAGQAERASGPARHVWRREHRLVDALERRTAAAAQEVWALTQGDADALRGSAQRVRVLAVPGAPVVAERADVPRQGHVAVLGTWTWGPNLEGLRWLLDEVAPRLGGSPEIVVGGRGAERLGPPPPGVRFAGFVPDAGEFLASAAAVAVPAVAGSGVQVKTLDAIGSGTRAVVTPLALRGIDDPPEGVQVTDDPAAFADALRQAVTAPRTDAGRRWAIERHQRFDADVSAAVQALGASS